ncbi:hypothetical protein Hdeb2414_s0438g00893681 [Helianthus debilis subsp. tardiflorus]
MHGLKCRFMAFFTAIEFVYEGFEICNSVLGFDFTILILIDCTNDGELSLDYRWKRHGLASATSTNPLK